MGVFAWIDTLSIARHHITILRESHPPIRSCGAIFQHYAGKGIGEGCSDYKIALTLHVDAASAALVMEYCSLFLAHDARGDVNATFSFIGQKDFFTVLQNNSILHARKTKPLLNHLASLASAHYAEVRPSKKQQKLAAVKASLVRPCEKARLLSCRIHGVLTCRETQSSKNKGYI